MKPQKTLLSVLPVLCRIVLIPSRLSVLLVDKLTKNTVGTAAEASKIISFLPNLITEPHVRNRFCIQEALHAFQAGSKSGFSGKNPYLKWHGIFEAAEFFNYVK